MDFKDLHARIEMQNEAKTAIRKSGYNATIIATVGFGKTKVMIDLAEELIESGEIKSILYLCDSRRLRDSDKDGFPAELDKWGSEKMRLITRMECYQTVARWVDQKYDLILGDEIDFAITPKYILGLLNNEYKYKILVSGTLTFEKKNILEKIAPIVYRVSTVDAEDAGVINKSEYYIYNYRLSESESKTYNTLTKKIGILSAAGATFADTDYMFWIRKRKQFLNYLDSSYLHCRKAMQFLWNKNKNSRVVIFCELTDQADRCCKWSFHGKNEQDDNLGKFQRGEISGLSVVAKIKRGINLKNADAAIFEGFSGSSTEWEQRNGRMKRLKLSEVATIIFLVPWYSKIDNEGNIIWKPTVVQNWINRATENISNIHFKTLKL